MARISKTDKKIIDNYFKNGFNQVRAYLTEHPDTKYDTARMLSSRLFAKDNVKAVVNKRFAESTMEADEALGRLGDIARADLSEFTDEKGNFDLQKLKEAGLGFMYKGTKLVVDKEGNEHLSIELQDPYDALKNILKIHGKFSVTKSFNLNIDLNQLSDEALERIAAGEDPLKVITSESATASSSDSDT